MHKRLIALLLCLPLLTACAGTAGPQEGAVPSADGTSETEGAADSEADPAAQETPASYTVVLFDRDGIRLELMDVPSFETAEPAYLLRMTNDTDHDLYVELLDPRLGDGSSLDAETSLSCDARSISTTACTSLRSAVVLAERAGVETDAFSCTLLIHDWSESRDYEGEYPVSAPLPDSGGVPVFEALCGMRADRQVLLENDVMKVTLLGCGTVPSFSTQPSLEGLLLVENRSSVPVPFMVNGILLNGMSLEVYDNSGESIPAGMSRYVRFNCYHDRLEDSGITQISSLELLLLTDSSENTGTFRMAGGSWYPVELAEHADEALTFEEGDLLYEDDYVRIGLRSAEATWQELEYADSYGSCEWVLAVTNKSDRNLELAVSDMELHFENYDPGDSKPYLSDDEIGAGARKYAVLRMSVREQTPLPSLSFRVQVRTAGGGKLLHYSDESVSIPAEQ